MFIGFLPKLVQGFALMSPLSVPNFSPIRARIHVLWWILRSVRNEEIEGSVTGWNPVQVIWNPSESHAKSGILPWNLESFG